MVTPSMMNMTDFRWFRRREEDLMLMRVLRRGYPHYCASRDALGWTFIKHRTHHAFHQSSVLLAWNTACQENATGGNKLLPASVKAAFEVVGVTTLVFGSILSAQGKNKTLLKIFGALAWIFLCQTLSERDSGSGGGGSDTSTTTDSSSTTSTATQTCTHPSIYRVYDMGAGMEKCTFCGEYIVDSNS